MDTNGPADSPAVRTLHRRDALASRRLGIGEPSSHGPRGIEKRLGALGRLTPLGGDRLLDIGCGDGAYTVRLAEGFRSVDAVDVEPERLEVFRSAIADGPKRDRITLNGMLAEELTFADDTFDAVTMIEVLEHVADLDRSLAGVHRVLKPGGRFLVTTPNRYFPIETHGFLVRGRRLSPARGPFLPWIVPLHNQLADARSFTVRGLTRTLAEHGFTRIGFDFLMPPFDQSRLGQLIRPITDRMERSRFLRHLGMALVIVAEKPRPSGGSVTRPGRATMSKGSP